MALPPINQEEFLKRLGQVAATKTASTAQKTTAPKNNATPAPATSGLQGLLDRKKTEGSGNLGLKLLSTALKPLTILDTPRRAIISGIRETVDALDGDPTTTASWNDFKKQTSDVAYGFGTAFPMKGFLGRAIGFIGDVALDPLTYATFGSTVAKKAVVKGLVDSTGKAVSTRAALGGVKNVSGRQGRAALAELSKKRLTKMADEGMEFTDGQIDSIVKDIYARGKSAMPGFLKDDIGIKGPGIYYFGSRVKVKGSGVIGDFLERKLTSTRLALVSPKAKLNPGQYVHRAITPDGTYQIGYVDSPVIKKYRVGLANGTLSPREAVVGMGVLRMADDQRLIAAKALEKGTQAANDVVTDSGMTNFKTELHRVLESGADVPPSDPRHFVVGKIRQFFKALGDDIDADAQNLDDTFVFNRRDNYVPHMESDQAIVDRIKMGEEAWDTKVSGMKITDTRKTASSFRGRKYDEGDIFFGHILTGDEGIDDLNRMARAPGDELNPTTGSKFDAIDYDYYETDMTKIVNKYVRHYAQQKGYFGFIRSGLENGPDFMRRIADDVPLAAEFASRRSAALPAELASVGPVIENITRPLNATVNAQASVLAGGTVPYLSGDSLLLPPATAQTAGQQIDSIFSGLTSAIKSQLGTPTPATVVPTPAVVATEPITKFQNTFLSNFAPAQIEYEGIVYPSNEHFYQAMKTTDIAKREQIAKAPNAAAAKRMGKNLRRPNWDLIKDKVMMFGLKQKFAPGSPLAEKLIQTGNAVLIEGNTWGDTYWGMVAGQGENRLGKMLMQIRDELNLSTTVAPMPTTTETVVVSKTLLDGTRAELNKVGETLTAFADNFDGPMPPAFAQIMEQYKQLSDTLDTQISNNVENVGSDIDFIEKFSQDLSKFGRDLQATMVTNNSVVKRSTSSVRAPKWFDQKSSPTNVAINDALNGNVSSLDTLQTVVERRLIKRIQNKLGRLFIAEAGDRPASVRWSEGMTKAQRVQQQELNTKNFRSRLSKQSGLALRLRSAREAIEQAKGLAYIKKIGEGSDRVAKAAEDMAIDTYERIETVYSPALRAERTIRAGFAVENLVHYSESLAEVTDAINAARAANYGYLPGDDFINAVVQEHKVPLINSARAEQKKTQEIIDALRTEKPTSRGAIDKIFGEKDVVDKFFKDHRWNNFDKAENFTPVKRFIELHLGTFLDDGILPAKLKLYDERIALLESPAWGREIADAVYPIHETKTTAQLNTKISDSPAMVQHQKDYADVLKGKAETAKSKQVEATRARELQGASKELRKEFYDYIRGRKTQAANFRKRIREQVLPKVKQAESDLEAFRAEHEKASAAWIKDVINTGETKTVYKARKVNIREWLRLKSLEHFPKSVGFFEEFAESNKGVFNFIAEIEQQAKTGVMSQWDYRIGLSILERTYANKYGTGIFESKTFDKIFEQFLNSPVAPTVTYEQFIDIATHSLGVQFFDDIDNMVMPTLIDLEARVATQQDYVLRLSAQAVKAEQDVMTITPNKFFNQKETGELGDMLPSQLKQAELEESDFYPFAKAEEKRANTLFALRNINGEMVDWTLGGRTQLLKNGQPFAVSEQQWSNLINTKDLSYVPGDDIDYVLSWLRQPDVQQIIAGSGKTNIPDEEMLQLFVNHVRSTQPMAVANDVRAQSRFDFISKAWEKSEAKKTLDEISRLKKMTADALAKKQNSNPVRIIDAELTDLNTVTTRRTAEGVAAQERVDAYGLQLDAEIDEMMSLREQLKEQLEQELDAYTPDTRPTRSTKSYRGRQAEQEVGIEPVNDDDIITLIDDEVLESGEMPTARRRDNEYLRLLKMGVPQDVLDGPLEGLNQWIRDNASSALGIIKKIEMKASDMDVYLTTSLVDKTPKQLVQEIRILQTLREKGIDTPATKGKTGRMIRERQRQLELKFTPEERATAEAAVEADRAVRPPINSLLSKIDGIGKDGKPVYNPEQLAMRQQVDRMVNPTPDPEELEMIGSIRPGEYGDPYYGAIEGGDFVEAGNAPGFAQATSANPAFKNIIEPDVDADLVDLENYIPLEPGERFPTSTGDMRPGRPLPVVEQRYEYNPDVEYNQQRRLPESGRSSMITPPGQEPIVISGMDDVLRELIATKKIPKNAKEPLEVVAVQFGVNLDGVNTALSKARLEAATQPNVGRVASDVPLIDTAALERVENAKQILNKVEKTGEATPLEEVLLDAGVREAELLATTADMTEEQIEASLLDGIAGMRRPIMLRNTSGELVEVPFAETGTIVVDELGRAWEKLSSKFGKIEVTSDFKDLWDNARYFEDPRFIKELTNYLGGFTKFHKAWATFTPGFHVRNLIGNSFQYILAGGKMENLKPATKIHFDWLAAYKKGRTWKQFLETLDPVDREAATIARNAMLGSGGGIYGDVFHEVVRGNKIYDNRLTRFSRKYGQMSDNMSRFVLGFDSAKQGMTSDMATARVRKFYFDYEDLSKLDRTLKQFVPFWIWTSRNLPLQLQNMWLNPKPYAIYNSFVRNVRDKESEKRKPLPSFLQEVEAFQIPGMDAYAAPDLNFTRVQQQLAQLGNPKKLGTNLNPLFRIPTEQVIGQNLYNDKAIETAQDRLINALQGLVVPVATGDRLLNSYGDAKINAWLGFFGSPVRKRKGE